jgi:hypothetical protein
MNKETAHEALPAQFREILEAVRNNYEEWTTDMIQRLWEELASISRERRWPNRKLLEPRSPVSDAFSAPSTASTFIRKLEVQTYAREMKKRLPREFYDIVDMVRNNPREWTPSMIHRLFDTLAEYSQMRRYGMTSDQRLEEIGVAGLTKMPDSVPEYLQARTVSG